MTEDELEIVRAKLKTEALLVLVGGLYSGLANSSPIAAQAIRDQFEKLRAEHGQIVLRSYSAEYSDMLAGEYQDALAACLKSIEQNLPVPKNKT